MIVYPAIDLRGGKVVRLREGNLRFETIFSNDPLTTARYWLDSGAEWLHVVNLDGAFSEANDNEAILPALARLGAKVQFGGGLRSLEDVELAMKSGVSRVVLGTLAIEEPDAVDAAVGEWGTERISIALDARDGVVTTRGWQQQTTTTPAELGKAMAARGVRHAIYTDVSRDGGLVGGNVEATIELARETGLQIVASGGVTTTDEIVQLAESGVVAGVIIGMALYQGILNLKDALAAAGGQYAR